MKTIGILGGMGPESTALFYQKVIRECQEQYGAKEDGDYPEIIIVSLPIPDIVESIENPEATITQLAYGIKKLENAGVSFIAVPCNTIQYFYPFMQKTAAVPVLNIVDLSIVFAKESGFSKVGILATEEGARIYQSLSKEVIELVLPQEQQKVTRIIQNILAGKKTKEDRNVLQETIKEMKGCGAEAIILGCTDLPLLIQNADILDSVEILAKATIRYWRAK